jgi:hypothetical protein
MYNFIVHKNLVLKKILEMISIGIKQNFFLLFIIEEYSLTKTIKSYISNCMSFIYNVRNIYLSVLLFSRDCGILIPISLPQRYSFLSVCMK